MFGLTSLELKLAALGVLLAVCTGYLAYEHHHLIAEGKASELALLKTSSDTLKAKVQEAIDQTNASHQADEKANQEKLNAALTASNSLSDALDKRVHDFDAYRRSHPDVARPPSVAGATVSGECGTLSCGDLASELAVRGDGLARSVGELSSTLQACQRDRDALTGLPKEIAK